MSQHSVRSTAQAIVNSPTTFRITVVLDRADHSKVPVVSLTRPRTALVPDSILNELASDVVLVRDWSAAETGRVRVLPWVGVADAPMAVDGAPRDAAVRPVSEVLADALPAPQTAWSRQMAAPTAWLTDILFAIGFCSYVAGTLSGSGRRARKWARGRGLLFSGPPRRRAADKEASF
jgi:hypothetical protein